LDYRRRPALHHRRRALFNQQRRRRVRRGGGGALCKLHGRGARAGCDSRAGSRRRHCFVRAISPRRVPGSVPSPRSRLLRSARVPCHRSVGAQRPAVERLRGPGRTRCTRHNYRLRRRDPGARHRTTAPRGVRQLRVRLAAGRRAAADGGDVAAVVRPRDRSRRCRQRDGFHTHHPEWRKLGGA
jgi:hypothetical protein